MNTPPPVQSVPQVVARQVTRLEAEARLDAPASALRRRTSSLASGPSGAALRGEWLGHALHPLLTDLPLGCWTASAVLDLTSRQRSASQRLVGMGVMLAVPTALSGLVEHHTTIDDERAQRVGVIHAIGNAGVILLYSMSWRSRQRGRHIRGVVYGLTGGVLALATGYVGGHLSLVLGAGRGRRGTWKPGAALPAVPAL